MKKYLLSFTEKGMQNIYSWWIMYFNIANQITNVAMTYLGAWSSWLAETSYLSPFESYWYWEGRSWPWWICVSTAVPSCLQILGLPVFRSRCPHKVSNTRMENGKGSALVHISTSSLHPSPVISLLENWLMIWLLLDTAAEVLGRTCQRWREGVPPLFLYRANLYLLCFSLKCFYFAFLIFPHFY